MIPESETVSPGPGGAVTNETPLPPSNSISSGGPPLQLKSGGPKGTSIEPASQYGIISVPRSPGKVTVCGSLGDFGVKTTLSPGLASRLRGKYSRSATLPSGLEIPAVTCSVLDPSLFLVTASRFAFRSAIQAPARSCVTCVAIDASTAAELGTAASAATTLSLPLIPAWTRQMKW